MEPAKEKRTVTAHPPEVFKKVDDAIEAGMSIRKACQLYGIPRSTFHDKKSLRTPIGCKLGDKPFFCNEEENQILNYINRITEQGFPLKMGALCDAVVQIVEEDDRVTRFANGRPGKGWQRGFLKRHPEVKRRVADNESRRRATISREGLDRWFLSLKNYLSEINQLDILESPDRMFNTFETGVLFNNLGNFTSLRKIGSLSTALITNNELVTVLCNFSAAGVIAPTMVLYKGKRINPRINESMPKSFIPCRTVSGLMSAETFLEYCRKFHAWLMEKGIPTPVLLLLGGNRSHQNIEISEFCAEHGIILFCLYPSASHIVQPADVGIYQPLKRAWTGVVHYYRTRHQMMVTKVMFSRLFAVTMLYTLRPMLIRDAFLKSGLFPFNPQAVDLSACSDSNITTEPEETAQPEQTAPQQQITLTPSQQRDALIAKAQLEDMIPIDLFEQFRATKQAGKVWSGDVTHTSLYTVWLAFCNKCSAPAEKVAAFTRVERADGAGLVVAESRYQEPTEDLTTQGHDIDDVVGRLAVLDPELLKVIQLPLNLFVPSPAIPKVRTHEKKPSERKQHGVDEEGECSKLPGKRIRKRASVKSTTEPKRARTAVDDDWICDVCGTSWYDEDKRNVKSVWFQCDLCTVPIHSRCIAPDRRIKFGILDVTKSYKKKAYCCEKC